MRSAPVCFALACLVVVLAWGAPRTAAAAEVDGRYVQGPLVEEYSVREWRSACGPAPQSTTTPGGETVEIRTEGDEIAIVGGGRVFRSSECYDAMPTLVRESHSRDPGTKQWRTRCATGANDPRRAMLQTLVAVTSERRVDVVETGRYEVQLENGRCLADVKRSRAFERLVAAPATPAPAATPAEAPRVTPAPTRSCAEVGDPTRLEVRPSRKLLRTGDAFQLTAVVVDAKGCATRALVDWKVGSGAEAGVTVDGQGRVAVAADAPEGTADVLVSSGAMKAKVVIEVTSPARYDELLARSGLNSAGENDAPVVGELGPAIGGREGVGEDGAAARRRTFAVVVGAAALALGLVAVVFSRRGRRAKVARETLEARHQAAVDEVLDRRRRREEEYAVALRDHERKARDAQSAARARAAAPPAGAVAAASPPAATRRCPTCGERFEAHINFCPHDATPLAGAGSGASGSTSGAQLAPAPPAEAGPSRVRICPTCGERFEGAAVYCGKDGTSLVLVN